MAASQATITHDGRFCSAPPQIRPRLNAPGVSLIPSPLKRPKFARSRAEA